MEYSVGSLADLISGQKTPNKTKLIQKTFTPIKKEFEPVFENDQSSKRPSYDKNISPHASSIKTPGRIKKFPSKFNKMANKSIEQNSSTENINDNLRSSKVKKNGSVKKFKAKENESIQENGIQIKLEDKKRKLDKSTDNLTELEDEETTPKKQKLSQSEKNAASRIKNKINQEHKNSTEYKERTIFIGNIPIDTTKKKIKQFFKKYGPIETIRIRGIPVADPKTTKKVAAIKKEFHPDRNTVHAYVRFRNAGDSKKAEAEDGQIFLEHHIRVNCCESTEKPDESKAIFVGNVPFNAEDEDLWKLFQPCGPISHVRIVRDGRTGIGKGFAYINFKDADSVQLALEMEKVIFKERELRISLCNINRAKKKKLGKKDFKAKDQKGKKVYKTNGAFAGTKFTDMKKKKKASKATLEKMQLAKKLVP